MALGVVLIVCGLGGILFGIAAAVGARDEIESKAVARGLSGEPLGFTALEGDDYTVFLLNAFGGTEAQERAVARTSCIVSYPAGGTQFSGSSQGFSLTIGNASSIGRFDTEAGDVEILCQPDMAANNRHAGHARDRPRTDLDHRRRVRDLRRDRPAYLGSDR